MVKTLGTDLVVFYKIVKDVVVRLNGSHLISVGPYAY